MTRSSRTCRCWHASRPPASAIQALSGVQISASDAGVELRATDMEIALRSPIAAEVERPGEVVLPARLLLEVVRRLSGPSVTIELRPEQQDVELVAGSATFHLRTLRAEDFPVLPEPGGDTTVVLPGRGVHRDDRPRLPLGVARRDAPDPHRRPRVGRGDGAADGRHGLLPAERQGDDARGAAGGRVRGQRAGAGARGARPADRRGRGDDQHRRAREPGRLRGRGRRALLAPDRRAVPELPPAAARARSSTS